MLSGIILFNGIESYPLFKSESNGGLEAPCEATFPAEQARRVDFDG